MVFQVRLQPFLQRAESFSWKELAGLCRKEAVKKEVLLPSALHLTALQQLSVHQQWQFCQPVQRQEKAKAVEKQSPDAQGLQHLP